MPLPMNKIPNQVKAGEVIKLSRILRDNGKPIEHAGKALGYLLIDLDRQGYEAEIVVRRKRGRPSNLSRFLMRQTELPLSSEAGT